MPEDKVRQIPFIQSLDRGLTILQAVALSKQPVSLGELTELLGIDRSSAFRLAKLVMVYDLIMGRRKATQTYRRH